MYGIYSDVTSRRTPNNDVLPPPLPPRSAQHQGRIIVLQEPLSRLPAVPFRPAFMKPPPYPAPVPPLLKPPPYPAPVPPLLEPPPYPAPVPPLLQAHPRMPLPGEAAHQSPAQRRGGPEFTPPTECIKAVRSGDVFKQLEIKTAAKVGQNNFLTDVNHQRYRNIDTCRATQLFTPEKKGLPANQMKVDGVNLAMRSQYPKPEGLREHLCMLADQKPGVLVVLSSHADITNRHLPAYFRRNDCYGDISVKYKVDENVSARSTKIDNLELNNYRIEITANGKTTPISVMHVTNWEDCTTIAPSALKKLVECINRKIEQQTRLNSGYKPQPFIHCSAGIGRTGVVAGAIEILKPGNKNMPEEIVLQLRESGCSKMVQTNEQFNTLVQLYNDIKSGH